MSTIGAPPASGAGAPAASGAAGTIGSGGASGGTGGASGGTTGGATGGATGTGPGRAIGTPAMSASGAAQAAAPAAAGAPAAGAAGAAGVAVADDGTHSYPPVFKGSAATFGLNAMATPNNPAPAATTLVLNRSKIAIDVDSFCMFERRRQLSAAQMEVATRRTAPFPNGDDVVTDSMKIPVDRALTSTNGAAKDLFEKVHQKVCD